MPASARQARTLLGISVRLPRWTGTRGAAPLEAAPQVAAPQEFTPREYDFDYDYDSGDDDFEEDIFYGHFPRR